MNIAFPGGNVLVDKTEGNTVYISPDLRGGKPWFYWYFEAQSSQPGRATFLFKGPGVIGVRGPAYSQDGGKNWQWMGADRIENVPGPGDGEKAKPQQGFSYQFTKANERVRFSVGIPYVQSNFDEFMAKQAGNPYLSRSVLTRSAKGRAVELVQIGKAGPGKRNMLLTARHHACEALASYVMEGFLTEALSESPAAQRFRENYVLYVVPFVDKDGVEDGDQGKNRPPHDHNRDYGDAPLYSEVKAIQELAARNPIQVALDLHCPALQGDIHEAFHFLGLGVPHVKNNLDEYISWIDEERPPVLGSPLDYLADASKPGAMSRNINAYYFATAPGALMAATLEIPYTQPKVPLDANLARQYGAGLLKALNRTTFVTAAPDSSRGADTHAAFVGWRTSFLKLYRSKPEDAEAIVKPMLDNVQAAPVYRVEANNLMATMCLWQHKYAEALPFAEAALKDGNAMTTQRIAAYNCRQRILSADPKTAPPDFETALTTALGYPALTDPQQASLVVTAVDFYEGRGELEKAISYARQLFPVAAYYEKGKVLLRIATLYDSLKQPDKALATRRDAVALLRTSIGPKPQRSVFGAMMTVDLFDAVMAIPTSTPEEKQAAADLALNHDVVAVGIKDRIRKALAAPVAP